ncbi:MAG: PIN domain-containing protein [Terriglobales bacterium]
MMVLVDTPAWSLALRRKPLDLSPREQDLKAALQELVQEGRVRIIGPVRQELLSGIPSEETFRRLRDALRPFDEPRLGIQDYEEAARIRNRCRARGIAGSAIAFLICAVAHLRNWEVFTTDHDFARYGKVVPLRLY